jgi:thioredoxin reductase (NADPH)
MSNQKIAIIGSGPAGLTASIYTARANIDTTVIMGLQPGGQLTTTTEIENFPGFVEGIEGGQLMENMQKQAERFGAKMQREEVKNIEIEYPAQTVIFATHNPSKVERINKYIKIPKLTIESPKSLLHVLENGNNEYENAKLKATAYFEKFQMPCFALDTGLYFVGVEDSEQPRQNVQSIAGATDEDTDEIRFQKMTTWYSNLATKYGGNLEGYWLDVYVLFDGKKYYTSECRRALTLTPDIFEKDVHLPVASLYKLQDFGDKYYHELTSEQKEEYMQPSMTALAQVLTAFVQNQKPKFILEVGGNQDEYDAVIIASGASAKYIGLPGEEKYIGKGYHSCATCDGFFYRKKEIIVVGGGDSAMEEANFLTRFASKVYLIHRSDKFRASKIMLDRAKNNPKIEFCEWRQIIEIIGEEKVNAVIIEDTRTKEKSKMNIDGIFVAIGHVPNTNFVKTHLETTESGYLTKPNSDIKFQNMSKIPGIFVAGDVEDQIYRQAITAAGEGCKASIDCERWLESIN